MDSVDYTFIFHAITATGGLVQFTDHRSRQRRDLRLAMNDDHLILATGRPMLSILADIVDLAGAVYVADRLSLQRTPRRVRLEVALPVRHPDVLGSAAVQALLREILFWYTGRHWRFDFLPRRAVGRRAELQRPLPHIMSAPATEVALWSGGLDALAGQIGRALANPTAMAHPALFGTGANGAIFRTQRDLVDRLEQMLPGQRKLIQLPIRLTGVDGLPTNGRARARGCVSLLLGAVCAVMEGQAVLHLYENGVGAVNLPLRAASIGLAHARSVHPRSLLLIGRLMSGLLGRPFRYENPFLFATKAQMCRALVTAGATELVPFTVSCDRRHRQAPHQCGYCSSCLLRRQALTVAGIPDRTDYRLFTPARRPRPSDGDHLRAMLDQVDSLDRCLRQPDPWSASADQFLPLVDIVDWIGEHDGQAAAARTQQDLVSLYRRYVLEWEVARPSLGEKLLTDHVHPTAA
ncbi:MAG: 7-cyano-7-deazaguanine synthase [Chloroflexi bacterium]|nr:7-cyano-7-deazaguanine synthase [Chloroflexota bacterium]